MAVFDVVKYPNPILRQICMPVLSFDAALVRFIQDMFETMDAADGIGLAAPQVGRSEQILVVGYKQKRFVLINPTLEFLGKSVSTREEGCLSLPKLLVDVTRPKTIRVKAQNMEGNFFEFKEKGMIATIIQHEYDHLNGVLIIDHGTPRENKSIEEEL
jgi:peptide deformylase